MKRVFQTIGILAALAIPARAQVGFSAGGVNYFGPNAINSIQALSIPYANDTVTGTTTNKLAKIIDASGAPNAILLATSDTTTGFGICSSGCGNSGTGQIDVMGITSCVFDGATTNQDYVIASTTTGGDCHDTGSATTLPTGVTIFGRVLSTNGGGGTYQLNLNTPDVASASSGPNGKGASVKGNGTTTNNIVDLNSTTPAAGSNGLNITIQTSTSGNTTSISGEVVGDGNATHCFIGTGTFSPCPGGATGHAVSIPFDSCSPDTTGNVFFQNTALTNWIAPHWEWVKNSAATLYCFIKIPGNVDATPAASVLWEAAANDSTAGHTDVFTASDVVITTGAIDVGSLTSEGGVTFTTTATAYARVTGSSTVAATVAANNILVVKIVQTASNSVTNNVFMWPYLKITVD